MINEISFKLPSQFLIYKITTSFEEDFDPLSMNSRIEVAKFKPGLTFEKNINEMKNNHMKSIASVTMNPPTLTLFDKNFEQIGMNSRFEVSKF